MNYHVVISSWGIKVAVLLSSAGCSKCWKVMRDGMNNIQSYSERELLKHMLKMERHLKTKIIIYKTGKTATTKLIIPFMQTYLSLRIKTEKLQFQSYNMPLEFTVYKKNREMTNCSFLVNWRQSPYHRYKKQWNKVELSDDLIAMLSRFNGILYYWWTSHNQRKNGSSY